VNISEHKRIIRDDRSGRAPPEPLRRNGTGDCVFFLLLLHHSQVEHFTKKENREGHHPLHPHHREKSSAQTVA
jgi:hypothetical protein